MTELDTGRHRGDEQQIVKPIANEAAPGNPDAVASPFFGSPSILPEWGEATGWDVLHGGQSLPPLTAMGPQYRSVQLGTNPHQANRRVPFQKFGGSHDCIGHIRPHKFPLLAIEREVTHPLTGFRLP